MSNLRGGYNDYRLKEFTVVIGQSGAATEHELNGFPILDSALRTLVSQETRDGHP